MTTFKKLPIADPNINAKIYPMNSGTPATDSSDCLRNNVIKIFGENVLARD
jgi:hypothetical protein